MIFNGVWLAYYLLQRDRAEPARERIARVACGVTPVLVAGALFAWYNWARFGQPLEMGLNWHNVSPYFQADFARYGVFNIHYLGQNLYYQFVAYTVLTSDQVLGGGLFWMTPVLIGAPYALWATRRSLLTWALVLSAVLVYIPIGLVMGTGFLTFGPRYLLDLMVPIVVLTARGIRRWNLDVLQGLMIVSWMTYLVGSITWLLWGLNF